MISNAADYLKNAAARYPDKTAFRDEEKSVTFSELDRRARSVACFINRKLGGATKRPIGVYLPKGVDSVIAFLGVAYSGNFYTPLDTRMPEARLKKILDTLAPAVVITDGRGMESTGLLPYKAFSFAEAADCEADDRLIGSISRSVVDTDILYVMFTSGSTGEPKGVIVSHRAVIDYTEWLWDTFGFGQDTIFGNQAPFHFDNSVLDIYSTLKSGCETVMIPEEKFLSAKRLCAFLDQSEINTIFWVPSALALVANSGILKSAPPKGLSKILFAGEVMPVKQLNIWRRFVPEALYANLYGPTEIAVDCTCYIVDRDFSEEESLPIGFPCKNTDVLVLNEKNGLVSGGETGELCVRGSCLSYGYYGNPEKTRAAFVQNPLQDKYPEKIYRTGDLVRYNERGELLYVGRKDFQIKHQGYRIELGEIETAAGAHADVTQCCAVYDDGQKRIVLFVAPENVNKKELYLYLKKLLPGYMLPGLILTKQALPLNPNGKTDRRALLNKGGEYDR